MAYLDLTAEVQEKQRQEEAIANTTGLRVLSAIASAVRVRLLKRDLLFIAKRLLSLIDDNRIEAIARQHGIRQKRDDGGVRKTLTAFLRRADEGTLSRLLLEASILLAASRGNASAILKDAATAYHVDTEGTVARSGRNLRRNGKRKKRNKRPRRSE